ncbi:MAG: PorT family protein [Prevotellaceae bacterium]|nr:PorT family protein [Prevotellaceae bacterium]
MSVKNHIQAGLLLCCLYFTPMKGEAQHFIGVREGVSTSSVLFNPARRDSATFQALNVGLVYKYYITTWTGLQLGVNYAEKGYMLEDTTRRYRVVEIPFLSQFHAELWRFRVLANAGVYAAYHLSAKEIFKENDKEIQRAYVFKGRDNRFEYGLHFGGGLGVMLHPFEVQFEVGYQYGLSYLLKPRYGEERMMFTHFTQLIISAAVLIKI